MLSKSAPKRKLNEWKTNGATSNESSEYEEEEGEDELDELESEEESDWDVRPKKKAKGKSRKVRKASSEEQETEEDILKRHRAVCEKCKQGPANILLKKALRKKQKGGKRRKKDEDAISEDEVAQQMQGWLEVSFRGDLHDETFCIQLTIDSVATA